MFGYFTAGANQNDNISNNPHDYFFDFPSKYIDILVRFIR